MTRDAGEAMGPGSRPHKAGWHADWIVPDWPAPAHVRAFCTTRAGGVSEGPFASLNLGLVPGDPPERVWANRRRVAEAIGAQPAWLSQVHGVRCVVLDGAETSTGTGTGTGTGTVIEADACATAAPRVPCLMRVADCLPVLFTDRAGTAVAAAHAGWRGLAQGVLEEAVRTFTALREASGSATDSATGSARDTLAWLGPCIGPRAFEVGAEVREAFLAQDDGAGICFEARPGGKWIADLQRLARRRLAALGVDAVYGNDGSDAWCTVTSASRFFSHRRDQRLLGGSGRMAACIWIG